MEGEREDEEGVCIAECMVTSVGEGWVDLFPHYCGWPLFVYNNSALL